VTEPCREYRTRLDALLDGELPEDEARALREHAAGCEACSAYLSESARLTEGLSRIALVRETPNLADAVAARIRRRLFARNAGLMAGLVALKVYDLDGSFGAGLLPRMIVVAAVLAGFLIIRVNPFKLIHSGELRPAVVPVEGAVS
jgi:anti-sigma factor RsiW